MSATVAIIWLVVFVIGVIVGITAIIALSALRKDPEDHDGPPGPDGPLDDRWPERDRGVSGIPGHWDSPRWPDTPDDGGKS